MYCYRVLLSKFLLLDGEVLCQLQSAMERRRAEHPSRTDSPTLVMEHARELLAGRNGHSSLVLCHTQSYTPILDLMYSSSS